MRSSIGRIPDELAAKIEAMAGVRKEPPPLVDSIDEKDFMAEVVNLAEENGWLVYHPTISRKSKEGYPDLTMVRRYVLFVELKTESGERTATQTTWGEALLAAGQDYRLWRPSDWKTIVEVLCGPH